MILPRTCNIHYILYIHYIYIYIYRLKGDVLCEMRFFLPNSLPEEEKVEKPEKEGEEEEEEDRTAAGKLHTELFGKAAIGHYVGESIATLPELPMIVPRGKCSLDMYKTFLKFHGRTHDYKILYRNINRAFLLPLQDGVIYIYIYIYMVGTLFICDRP